MPRHRGPGDETRQKRWWLSRWAAIWPWCYLTWLGITWDKAAEQVTFGAISSAIVALALVPLGPVLKPWGLLSPRRDLVLLRIGAQTLGHLVMANLSLSKRIWSPSRPLKPGMIVVPTSAVSEGELAAVGMLTSLVVDNQLIDLDRRSQRLQYHAVWCDSASPEVNRSKVNGPLEQLLAELGRS